MLFRKFILLHSMYKTSIMYSCIAPSHVSAYSWNTFLKKSDNRLFLMFLFHIVNITFKNSNLKTLAILKV